jgi:hypothetical protein
MTDLWAEEGFGGGGFGDEGFGAEDDWDEGEESLETDVESGFDDLGEDEPDRDSESDD